MACSLSLTSSQIAARCSADSTRWSSSAREIFSPYGSLGGERNSSRDKVWRGGGFSVGPLWYAVPEADAVSDVDLREHRFRQFMSSHRPPVGIGSSGPRLRENSASAMNPMNRREGHRWRVSSKGVDRTNPARAVDVFVDGLNLDRAWLCRCPVSRHGATRLPSPRYAQGSIYFLVAGNWCNVQSQAAYRTC